MVCINITLLFYSPIYLSVNMFYPRWPINSMLLVVISYRNIGIVCSYTCNSILFLSSTRLKMSLITWILGTGLTTKKNVFLIKRLQCNVFLLCIFKKIITCFIIRSKFIDNSCARSFAIFNNQVVHLCFKYILNYVWHKINQRNRSFWGNPLLSVLFVSSMLTL